MPYKIVQRDAEFCVYKLDEDNQPVGKPLGCHKTRDEAEAQMSALYANEPEGKAVWTARYINDLPDSAFLYIEAGGKKDEEGKTVPRSLRHFPIYDADGKLDLPHLRNAIARIPQSNAPGLTDEKKRQLQEKARKLLARARGGKALLVKSDDGDVVTLAGWGVLFDGEDLQGESFSKDTDFWLDKLPGPRPVLYDHSFDASLGLKVLGHTTTIEPLDEGLWLEMQLQRHQEYMDGVMQLIEKGALGVSSATAGHLARCEGKRITVWPIVEFSLTPVPAEPRTLGVSELRSLALVEPSVKSLLPKDGAVTLPATEALEQQGAKKALEVMMGEIDIEETVSKAATKAVEEVWKRLAAEKPEKTGEYATLDAAVESQEGKKNFADFLLAVRRKDVKYLAKEFKSTQVESEGALGGFLVPEAFRAELLKLMEETAIVRPRATIIPAELPVMNIPVLDQVGGPTTAGDPVWYGGVHLHWTEEAGAKTETNADFDMLTMTVHEISGYTQASNAIAKDSAKAGLSIVSLIQTLFASAFAWQEDYVFLRGNGVAKPLGVLNAKCLKTVNRKTVNDIVYEDLAGMFAAFFGQTGVWLVSRSAVAKLLLMEDTEGHLVWQPNAASAMPGTILGMPVLVTEKLPALGSEGDLLLADFSKYLIYDMGEFAVDFSEHYAFTSNKGTWRCSERIDGRPWLSNVVTLTDGSTTVSPFVALK